VTEHIERHLESADSLNNRTHVRIISTPSDKDRHPESACTGQRRAI
jgi:hypothetical protein